MLFCEEFRILLLLSSQAEWELCAVVYLLESYHDTELTAPEPHPPSLYPSVAALSPCRV